MAFVKFTGLLTVVLFLGACASASTQVPGAAYEAGYRQGVKENIRTAVEQMNGNDFPYMSGTWAEPLVQKTRIPAHVQGGVFYPEHDELVIITPGEWRKAGGYPIRSAGQGPTVAESSLDLTVLPQEAGTGH